MPENVGCLFFVFDDKSSQDEVVVNCWNLNHDLKKLQQANPYQTLRQASVFYSSNEIVESWRNCREDDVDHELVSLREREGCPDSNTKL